MLRKSLGYWGILSLIALGGSITACEITGTDPDSFFDDIVDDLAGEGFPTDFAVASPTASLGAFITRTSNVGEGKSFHEKRIELERIFGGDSAEDCELGFSFQPIAPPDCYGPQLDYQNHPDGTPADGQLPSGDLGIWTETEGGEEACVAATLNNLISKAEQKLDEGLYLAAAMRCLMNVDGTALPSSVGDSVDLTTEMDTMVSDADATASVSVASITLQASESDANTYLYQFDVERGSDNVSIHMAHRDGEGDAYVGRLWIENEPNGVPVIRGYTLDYERDGDELAYEIVGADFSNSASDLFDDEGVVDLTQPWQGNAIRLVANTDQSSGDTQASFAWQAGSGDSHARILNVFTEFGEQDATGCGFFGYGGRFDQSAGTASDNQIDTFICNWAGPGNSHTGEVGYAQKQCMQTNTSGIFVPNQSNISYAPVNDCDSTGDGFEYKFPHESVYQTDAITKDLVELSGDSDFANYTAPSAPAGL